MSRGSVTWLRRGSFIAVLLAVAITPGPASASRPCPPRYCQSAGTVRWERLLPGAWVAAAGIAGTAPAQGEAYAALGSQVAAVGVGTTIYAYRAGTGTPLWTAQLAGFPAGSSIVSLRAWPGVVTAGVDGPAGAAGGSVRREVVLSARHGRQIRSFAAASFGGAVTADGAATVIVGNTAVTRYSNRTGDVSWSKPTGPAAQAWRVDGGSLYVTVAAGGYLATGPVTALRRINLRTGAEHLVRPRRGSFTGVLSRAFDGVVVFSGPGGTTAYSGKTGRRLWHRAGAVPENADSVAGLLYLTHANALVGVDPQNGRTEARVSGASAAGSSGLYAIRAGVVLGLDEGAQGDAWGYDVSAGRVVWTSASLPWPHYFVDLSGVGGSTDPGGDAVLLAVCAQLGPAPAPAAGPGQACLRPELAELNR